jgi:hypothetical protein
MRYVTDSRLGRCLFLDDPAEWGPGMSSRHETTAEIETGLTGRERRAQRSPGRLRSGLSWKIVVSGKGMAAVRNALADYELEPVLFPFWPGFRELGTSGPAWQANRWLWIDRNHEYTLVDFTPGPADEGYIMGYVPVLAGRFKSTPVPVMLTTESVEYALDCEDTLVDGALWVTGASFSNGPAAGDGVVRLIFPSFPDMATPQASGSANTRVDWSEHRPSLTDAPARYPQPANREMQTALTLLGESPIVLTQFFAALGGSSQTCWLPQWLHIGGLAEDVSAGASSIRVLDPDGLAAMQLENRALFFFDVPAVEVVQSSSVTGDVVSLMSPLTLDWDAQTTVLGTAILARFASQSLDISWQSVLGGTAVVRWMETPNEYGVISGEIAGSQGTLPVVAHLFRFTRQTNQGVVETRRFTDMAGSSLQADGEEWTCAQIEHDQTTDSLSWDDVRLSLRTQFETANPLWEIIAQPMDTGSVWKLTVKEWKGADPAKTIFVGEILSVEADGPFLSATLVQFGGLPERKFPSALVQTSCNYALFSRACTLLAANWRKTVTVNGLAGTVYDVTTPALPAGWFAGGIMQMGGRLTRIRKDELVGGIDTHHLWTAETVIGELTSAFGWPGCDGLATTCKNKFDNYANFGGFPFLPVGNPSNFRVRQEPAATGKK